LGGGALRCIGTVLVCLFLVMNMLCFERLRLALVQLGLSLCI